MKPHYAFIFIALFVMAISFGKDVPLTEKKILEEFHKINNDINNGMDVKNCIEHLTYYYNYAKANNFEALIPIGIQLANIYSITGRYHETLDIIKEVKIRKKTIKNHEVLAEIYRLKALSYSKLGFLEESHDNFIQSKLYTKKIIDKDSRHFNTSWLYKNKTHYFNITENSKDSVAYYLKASLYEAEKISDHNTSISLTLKQNMIVSLQKDLGIYYMYITSPRQKKLAKSYFDKALLNSKEINVFPLAELSLYVALSKFYLEEKNYMEAKSYAEQAIDIEKGFSSPYLRETLFGILIKVNFLLNNTEASIKYSTLSLNLKDSISLAEKQSINKIHTYLTLENKKKYEGQLTYYLILLGFISILFIGLFRFYYIKKNKKFYLKHQNFSEEKIESPEPTSLVRSSMSSLAISDQAIDIILKKLTIFETHKKYLNQEVSLTWLASYFNTNTKYLSYILKNYRNKNFRSYLNGLRIDYITNKLHSESVFKKFKISYLAEKCGYASSQVFVKAFKKETGITPSQFIEFLENDNTKFTLKNTSSLE